VSAETGLSPDEFIVDAVWRDDEKQEDDTYLDYMCRTCIEKIEPFLKFFEGSDKEMLRKCRAFLSHH